MRLAPTLSAVIVTALSILVFAPGASAGVLSLSEEGRHGPIPTMFAYAGLPGEANQVHVSLDGQQLTILDPGKLIIPNPTQLFEVFAHCSIEIGKACAGVGRRGSSP